MVRIIIAAALALAVAFSAAAVAQQGARASRWQPDQFGPIVPTDTMWSIAGYYSRQQGVRLHEMMDRIVAANPRAFRDNRPDFMLTGFFLDIPELGEATAPVAAQVATREDEPESASEDAANEVTDASETTVDTSVESEIAISVSELQALRSQLSDSINLIENLQGENSELQERLAAVTRELNELRARADVEQQASSEMELIAQELSNEEITSETITNEPETSNPANEQAEPAEDAAQDTSAEEPVAEEATAAPASAEPEQESAEGPATAAVEQTEQVEQQTTTPVVTKRKQESWLDWLLKPFHLAIAGGLLVLLLGIIGYALYVRRINREIEEGSAETVPADATTAAEPEADEPTSEALAVGEAESPEEQDETATDWQETSVGDDYAEVTDVDLDEYLRGRGTEDSTAETAVSEDTDLDDNDPMSKEVDALLAMEFPTHEDEPEPEGMEPADDVAEFRVPEPEPTSQTEVDDEERSRDELDEALDSFGGLRLDDEQTDTSETDEEEDESPSEEQEKAEDKSADEEDYLSIESLMEEAETEASEEQDDPYDKEKLSDALGGEDSNTSEIDLSTEAMLDESKSPAAKLDLAQVYIDMGEVDDARELLESIQGCGDEEAERDAAELLQKLAEQGGR